MRITFTPTVHGTVHAIGTAELDDAATLRRSISVRAGKQKFGKRLRITETRADGLVTVQAAYAATK